MAKANNGRLFRDKIIEYIKSWKIPEIEIKKEYTFGYRITGQKRQIDIVLKNNSNNKYLGIECKFQLSSGTASEKLIYTIVDAQIVPFTVLIAFGGPQLDNIKGELLRRGIGYPFECEYNSENSITKIEDKDSLFKQRVLYELGLE